MDVEGSCSDVVKEFGKYDNEPSKYVKQLMGRHQRTQQPWQCDIAYERFLGPEVREALLGLIVLASPLLSHALQA